MVVVVLRLTLTPLTVLIASLVQRRLGPTLGGRVIGLPLTTAPFLLLLGLGSGVDAATQGAAGVVAGQLAVVGFCLGYGHIALRGGQHSGSGRWLALTVALTAAAAGTAVSALVPMTVLLVLLVLATITIGLATLPMPVGPRTRPRTQRRWEVPVRMAVSGVLVASLLGLAPVLGPHLAGVLATMPVILTVLAPATHGGDGANAASALVRGALASMPSSVVFAAVLSQALVPLGLATAFGVAAAALVVTDGAVMTATAALGLRTRRSDLERGDRQWRTFDPSQRPDNCGRPVAPNRQLHQQRQHRIPDRLWKGRSGQPQAVRQVVAVHDHLHHPGEQEVIKR
jgi:hypothetical protein